MNSVDNITVAMIAALLLAIAILGRHISLSIGGIKAELKPNGGSSLRDAIDRVEMKFDNALDLLSDRLTIVENERGESE